MSLSRREFCQRLGSAVPGTMSLPLALEKADVVTAPSDGADKPIRLDSNENPYGPSPAARAAIARAVTNGGRYPGDAVQTLIASIAEANGVAPVNVMLTVGSTEALQMCARAFTRRDAGLVTAAPTYEAVAAATERLGHPVIRIPVLDDGRLDLETMAQRAAGSGLVYLCNPNNPTGVSHSAASMRAFIARVADSSPTTTILVGEAYHEYVDTPAYASAVPDALTSPRVLVTRTFSKLYGLAGLRIGYVIGAELAIRQLNTQRVGLGANILAVSAATAAINDPAERLRQQRLNREGRVRTERFFRERGWRVYPGEANFLFVDIKRDVVAFRAACEAKGLLIGRLYPPATTWARITIGTPSEMRRALPILAAQLAEA